MPPTSRPSPHTGGVKTLRPLSPDDSPIVIRPATMADSAGIAVVRNAAVRESLALWTDHELSPGEAEAWLSPAVERRTALVAVERADGECRQDRVVAFAVATPWHPYPGYARTVEDSVYVADGFEGRGIGRALLTALIEASRSAGDRTMVAAIESGNRTSVHLHERHGFVEVGTIPRAGEKLGQVLGLTLMYLPLS